MAILKLIEPIFDKQKGQKRWRARSGNQIERLKTKIENSLRQNETNHEKVQKSVIIHKFNLLVISVETLISFKIRLNSKDQSVKH